MTLPTHLPADRHRQALALGLELVAPGTYQVSQSPNQAWLPLTEAAVALQVHPRTLTRWRDDGRLEHTKHWRRDGVRCFYCLPAIQAMRQAEWEASAPRFTEGHTQGGGRKDGPRHLKPAIIPHGQRPSSIPPQTDK